MKRMVIALALAGVLCAAEARAQVMLAFWWCYEAEVAERIVMKPPRAMGPALLLAGAFGQCVAGPGGLAYAFAVESVVKKVETPDGRTYDLTRGRVVLPGGDRTIEAFAVRRHPPLEYREQDS